MNSEAAEEEPPCSPGSSAERWWVPGRRASLKSRALSLQDRVQADDLVTMLFSPEEMDLPQEQPQEVQQGPPQPVEESVSSSESGPKDEL